MNFIKYDDNILYFENAIPNVKEFIERVEKTENTIDMYKPISKWIPWVDSSGQTVYGQKKYLRGEHFDLSDPQDVECKEIYEYLNDIIEKCVKIYCQETGRDMGNVRDKTLYIKKYYESQDMGFHVDTESVEGPTISSVAYLNDDYEGGEIYFIKQDITIKPKAGSIVVFPSVSPYYHQSKQLLSGRKYIVPTFYFRQKDINL